LEGEKMSRYKVVFSPDRREVNAEEGITLLEAADLAGIHINNLCGGQGVCGECKVRITRGIIEKSTKSISLLSRDEIQQGYVLSCQTPVRDNLEVEIPVEARLEGEQILMGGEALTFSIPEEIEGHLQEEAGVSFYSPLTMKMYLKLPLPNLEDNLSDLERIYREVQRKANISDPEIELYKIRGLARILRKNEMKITATLGRKNTKFKIIQIQGGDTSKTNFGIAMDIGTTTVVAQLIDMNSKEILGTKASHNRQSRYGEDVISRIIYACNRNGMEPLNKAVIGNIGDLVKSLARENGVELDEITAAMAAGNTTMTHLLLGLEPCFIRTEPYIPTATSFPVVKASDVWIPINPDGLLGVMPCVSSYVGGDITAGVLASGMCDSSKVSMLMDLGTNGEIVLGNCEWLVCCSASVGPAFEGGGLKCGMRATNGAIQAISISDDDVNYSTIGNGKPRGICGSGVIDVMCELFKNRLVNPDGKFNTEKKNSRMRETEEGMEFVIAWAEESETGRDIVVTEYDISNLIKSKGAVYAAATVLAKSVGIDFKDIDRIFVAGGFGNFLNIEKAITIGLLPDLPLERFRFIGNSSLAGARMALLSNHAFERAHEIARKMTYFELSVNPDFMDEFIAALFLPHTNQKLFPSLIESIR
jgi:uncharacterized 2Fe-2S/4Fe-4S cluster protein (DUF4445 family)